MRPRALSLALLALLVAACGAPVTVRVPLRIRLGGPTAPNAPTPTIVVVLPFTATPPATTAAVAAHAETPTAPPALTATQQPPLAATARPSRTAAPTATVAPATPTTAKGTATADSASAAEAATATPRTPSATPVNTPPPRRPAAASAYAVRLQQLRFSVRGEFVQIINRGPDQDLSGWRLFSAGADAAFAFPDGYILRQGETVTVHSGADDVPTAPGHLQWTPEGMWRNASEEALLYDAQGALVDRWPRR